MFWRKKSVSLPYTTEADTFAYELESMVPQIQLDYSPESLSRLEQLIRSMPVFHQPESRATWSRGLGCYIGEVLIRTFGGRWLADGSLQLDGFSQQQLFFPIVQAEERLQKDTDASLLGYYHAIGRELYQANEARQAKSWLRHLTHLFSPGAR